MDKVCPWCGQPSDRGRLRNRTEPTHCPQQGTQARDSVDTFASRQALSDKDSTVRRIVEFGVF